VYDDDDFLDELQDEERIKYLYAHWKTHFEGKKHHSGDCTDFPWRCTKCHEEYLTDIAKKIMKVCDEEAKDPKPEGPPNSVWKEYGFISIPSTGRSPSGKAPVAIVIS
jgi:hypothetical protein